MLTHEFVEYVPAELADGVLYISIIYRSAVRRCACGCGNKVVTPITPADWQLPYDGDTVSLTPSIGNWGPAVRTTGSTQARSAGRARGQAIKSPPDGHAMTTGAPSTSPSAPPLRARRRQTAPALLGSGTASDHRQLRSWRG